MWGWIKIRSWHRVRTATRVPGRYITFCGKQATGDPQDSYTSYEKTCEACFRLSGLKEET